MAAAVPALLLIANRNRSALSQEQPSNSARRTERTNVPLDEPPSYASCSPATESPEERKNGALRPILLTTLLVVLGGSLAYYKVAFRDTSRPCETNAFLDKAYNFQTRHLSDFHYTLNKWILGDSDSKCMAPPAVVTEELYGLIEGAEDLQRAMVKDEKDDYRNKVALHEVHFAQAQNKSLDKIAPIIERYLKSLNIDRIFVIERSLVNFIAFPEDDAAVTLNASLAPFELKVAQLKEGSLAKFRDFIDAYWSNLKRSTVPGIFQRCLPKDFSAENIIEKYTKMVQLRVTHCIPPGEREYKGSKLFYVLLVVVMIAAWFLMIGPVDHYCSRF
uniref:Uncharacterized protein n=1 Tax=Steinernema glaseri TaxID=37863 RepID=A0A1I8AMD2_9BILA